MTTRMIGIVSDDELRQAVRARYSQVAERHGGGGCATTGSACCGPTPVNAGLRPGETVLDLGSGGGFDCFSASRQVGDEGRVIGVDMTPTMISKARPDMLQEVVRFLADVDLPTEDIGPAGLAGIELATEAGGRIVGAAGLDVFGPDALLRSVAVIPDFRGRGLGADLVARREAAARIAGVGAIYLLTTTADGFFRRLGYTDIARATVPPAIAAHAQFRTLCPASAQCLGKRLR